MNLVAKLRKALSKKPKVRWELRPTLLLCPNTPQPLHGVVPREILGGKWWRETRRAAFKSTDYHCQACGVSKYAAAYHQWLEGHEVYDIDYLLGRMTYLETVPLCHFCHNYIHSGRLQALLEKGEIHHAKYAAIRQHGDRVLKEANLRKKKDHGGLMADWGDWRLVLNSKEHPPKYHTFEEWSKEFG